MFMQIGVGSLDLGTMAATKAYHFPQPLWTKLAVPVWPEMYPAVI